MTSTFFHMEPLQAELVTYRTRLPELLKESGKFVVIRGDEILGTYTAYEDALAAGYKAYKLEPFLVKKVAAFEPVNFSSRMHKAAA